MITWIKEHWIPIVLGFITIIVIAMLLVSLSWLIKSNTCIQWTDGPLTGKSCIEFGNVYYPCGEKQCINTQCIRWKPCRTCTEWVDSNKAPAELIVPIDSCN
jgi:hypothetical protein